MKIHEEIVEILKKNVNAKEEVYTNPNFLSELMELLYDYYKVDDSEVDDWIDAMYSM